MQHAIRGILLMMFIPLTGISQAEPGQTIRFSTIPNTKQKALEPYYQALKNAEFGVQRFSVIEQLATYHVEKGNSDSILYYGNLYLKEVGNWHVPENEKAAYATRAYYLIGEGNRFNGLFDNAIQFFIKGIREAEASENKEFLYKNNLGLAHIYIQKNELEKAIALLTESLSLFGKEFPGISATAQLFLGDAHFKSKSYDKAASFYRKSIGNSMLQDDVFTELSAKLKLGDISEETGEFDQAFNLYNETRETGLKKGFHTIYFEGCIRIGRMYYRTGNYQAVNVVMSTAYVNALERENLHFQEEILDLQRMSFVGQKDYENAYAVMTQLAYVKSQISEQQQRKISKELEVQYETLKKEKEILSLQDDQIKQDAELKRQRTIKNAILIGFLIILIPVMALLFVYYQKILAQTELAKKQEEINEQKVTSLKQKQELNLIKASLDGQDEERKRIAQELHDSIGGNLAGIKLHLSSLTKGAAEFNIVTGQLDETYQLVRDISHTLIPARYKENAFTDLLKQYANSISSSGEIAVGLHLHPEERINGISDKKQMELFKIIQELMTNTLKHAHASKVAIHLSVIDEEISLLFEDNGKGFNPESTSNGIGFENIRNRVTELSGIVHIDAAENRGAVISIEIPNS